MTLHPTIMIDTISKEYNKFVGFYDRQPRVLVMSWTHWYQLRDLVKAESKMTTGFVTDKVDSFNGVPIRIDPFIGDDFIYFSGGEV
jgi:hypothetical protein